MAQAVIRATQRRYGGIAGDDATFVGVLARKPRRLIVFTGPPADKGRDEACVERLLRLTGSAWSAEEPPAILWPSTWAG